MYYENKVRELLGCSEEYAAMIVKEMAPYIDFSEVSWRTFKTEVFLTDYVINFKPKVI
jgi:hypothetical protein